MELMLEFMGKGLLTMLMISLPCVLTAAAVGLVVGVLQAVTQVQEQTIAAAPKILAVFLVIMVFGVGYVRLLTNLIKDSTQLAFNIIPKSDNYVLPADYYRYTKPFADEMKDGNFKNVPSVDQVMKNAGKPPFIDNSDKLKYNAAGKVEVPYPNFIERKKIMGR
ncbi:MAG: flagellar biosynthetic protein FliQ [Candidatus Gastranaerophilales bacterium]|nr:flagellar biosynthetic protein FliQ [Candidatus Gastranaerophilales bacterium]